MRGTTWKRARACFGSTSDDKKYLSSDVVSFRVVRMASYVVEFIREKLPFSVSFKSRTAAKYFCLPARFLNAVLRVFGSMVGGHMFYCGFYNVILKVKSRGFDSKILVLSFKFNFNLERWGLHVMTLV